MTNPNTYDKDGDIIILVLGQTGSGKSTFINSVIGKDLASVGHGLQSHTKSIQPFTVAPTQPKESIRRVVLLDTPGFNDSELWNDDRKILKDIVQWLNSCKPQTKFAGIIYLHEITQPRNPPEQNFMTPTKLSNPKAAQNVVLTTVKWDQVQLELGVARELELKENWKAMRECGSQLVRFTKTRESAWEIVNSLLNKDPINVSSVKLELERILGEMPKEQKDESKLGGILSFLFGRRRKDHPRPT